MWKTLVDRLGRIFDQSAHLSPQGKSTYFTKLFQRSPELGDGPSLLNKIKRLIDRIKTGTKQVQVDQQDLMAKLRQSVPTTNSMAHIKDVPIAKHQSRPDPLPRFLPMPLDTFEPGDLGIDIDDLTYQVADVINDPAKRLVVTTHLMAADRIHTSVCESYLLLSVDRNLNLGESNAPIAILATLDEINKDKLSKGVQQSMEVLSKSVAFYNGRLQR